jgi:membrane protein YqaA with SNARE-associated domain
MHGFIVWLQEVLLPRLGPAGVFVVAFFDSSFLSLPEVNDVFVVSSSAANPARAWIAVLATTLGSISGCSALWLIGKRGGEPFLLRRFGAGRVERTRHAFRRWDLLALAVPAVLPPPMPFKMFVFSAGVFGVPYARFLLTIVIARGLRYSFWGTMGALYGARALGYLTLVDAWFVEHLPIVAPVLVLLAIVVIVLVRRRARAQSDESAIIER